MMRFTLLALAFLSGSVALSHELLWTRRLIDLLGASDWVTGRVLGLFFLGLSIGGWIAASWTERKGNIATRLGMVELAIAFLALPALFLPLWADWIIAALGTDVLISWQGKILKLLLSGLVVLPPAIGMGMTMPLFIRVSTELGGSVERSGILIYSINMLGGVFGLWLTSTQLLDSFGIQGTMLVALSGNCLIALVVFVLSTGVAKASAAESAKIPQEKVKPDDSTRWTPGIRGVYLLAFVSGAFVLALEVLIFRLLALVAPSSFHTTSAMLANVILFLSVSAFAVALLNRLKISSLAQLITGLGGAAIFCALCPLILYHHTDKLISVRYLVSLNDGTISSMTFYWLLLFYFIAASAGATLLCSGLVFPSILSINSKTDPAGNSVGRLLAINGVGGLVGCEIANSILISAFGIYGGFIALAIFAGITALVLCCFARFSVAAMAVVTASMALTTLSFGEFDELRYLSPRSTTKYVIEKTDFGPAGVLLVIRDRTESRSLLLNNQYILGSSQYATIERRQLLLPWMLNPKSKNVCCLGFATGISASGLEVLRDPPPVTAVELSGMVAEVACDSFREENLNFKERPGNRVVEEDGRTFIAAANEEYDLIVADLFRPHGAGEGRLFSLEHYRNVKRAMTEDGMFCQWLPAHQLNETQFRMIAATFLKVFPETLVINGGSLTRTPSIGLCAWKSDKKWEAEELKQRIAEIRKEEVTDKLVRNAHLLVNGVLKKDAFAETPINTLDNAALELNAGRFWLLKDLRPDRPEDSLYNGFLSGPNWERFLIKLREDTTAVLDPEFRDQYLQILD